MVAVRCAREHRRDPRVEFQVGLLVEHLVELGQEVRADPGQEVQLDPGLRARRALITPA